MVAPLPSRRPAGAAALILACLGVLVVPGAPGDGEAPARRLPPAAVYGGGDAPCRYRSACNSPVALCCENATDPDVRDWVANFSVSRDLPAELLLPMVVHGLPVFYVTDMRSTPRNAETLNNEALRMRLDLDVIRIDQVDQKSQTFRLQYEVTWLWRDCRILTACVRLTVEKRSPHFASFYTPDVRIEEMLGDDRDMREYRHQLGPGGWHAYTERHSSIISCKFNFASIPYDSQTCRLTFSSMHMMRNELLLLWGGIRASRRLENSEWAIQPPSEWQAISQEETYGDALDEQGVSKSVLVAEFVMERGHKYLVHNFALPSLVVFLVCWVGLWVDIKAVPARTFLACVPVIIQSSRLTALHAIMPPISYETRLGNLVLFVLLWNVLHVLEFGLVHWVNLAAAKIDKKKTDEESGTWIPVVPGEEAGALIQAKDTLVLALRRHLEFHFRWISMLGFLLGFILSLAVDP